MHAHVALLLLAATATTGCATSVWEMKYGKEKPPISYTFAEDGASRDGIYAWKPDAVAAVSRAAYELNTDEQTKRRAVITYNMPVKNESGSYADKAFPLYTRKTCVMSAAAIKERNSEGGFNLTVNPKTGDTSGTVGGVSRELQKVTVLASTSEAATFLDVAMFGICMAAMNGDLDKTETMGLFKHSITEAAKIAIARGQTTKVITAGEGGAVAVETGTINPGEQPVEPKNPSLAKDQPKSDSTQKPQ